MIRKINFILSIILTLLAIYITVTPIIPQIAFSYNQATDPTKGYKYKSILAEKYSDEKKISLNSLKPIPSENTLVIPQAGVDAVVFEGQTPSTLDKGVWRRPKTSTPDKGGNTVLTAHRFLYTNGPNTFYSLDKVKVGDKFSIFWKSKEYNYEVFEIKEVKPTAVEVEYNTKDPIITLYTCTLWTAENRLVVKAKLINLNS